MHVREDLDASKMKKATAGAKPKHDPLKLLELIRDTSEENAVSLSEWAKRAKVVRQTLTNYAEDLRTKGFIATAGEGIASRKFITNKGKAALGGAVQ
jgi:hypothetical protein